LNNRSRKVGPDGFYDYIGPLPPEYPWVVLEHNTALGDKLWLIDEVTFDVATVGLPDFCSNPEWERAFHKLRNDTIKEYNGPEGYTMVHRSDSDRDQAEWLDTSDPDNHTAKKLTKDDEVTDFNITNVDGKGDFAVETGDLTAERAAKHIADMLAGAYDKSDILFHHGNVCVDGVWFNQDDVDNGNVSVDDGWALVHPLEDVDDSERDHPDYPHGQMLGHQTVHPKPKEPMISGDVMAEFDVKCKMKARWVPHFLSMLAEMENLGDIGSSRFVSIFSDGDGDFRPKFSHRVQYDKVEANIGKGYAREFDAG
jgi:hypothetical protein